MDAGSLSFRIKKGDIGAIREGLFSDNSRSRAQAIISIVNFKIVENDLTERIRELLTDDTRVIGYLVSDFAAAVLVKLGELEYKGNRAPEIKKLVDADTWFI